MCAKLNSKYFTKRELSILGSKNIPLSKAIVRITRYGWTKKEAMELKERKRTRRKVKRDWKKDKFAVYKGEELLTTGTVFEIAEELGMSVETAKFNTYPSHHKKDKGKRKLLVYIGRDDEEEME